jgi:hypothetical protein
MPTSSYVAYSKGADHKVATFRPKKAVHTIRHQVFIGHTVSSYSTLQNYWG